MKLERDRTIDKNRNRENIRKVIRNKVLIQFETRAKEGKNSENRSFGHVGLEGFHPSMVYRDVLFVQQLRNTKRRDMEYPDGRNDSDRESKSYSAILTEHN